MPRKRTSLERGPLDGLLGFHLRRAQQRLFQDFKRSFAAMDITPGQLGLLMLIASNAGVSQIALAAELGIERSTLGQLIDRFEKRGLTERRASREDSRSHALHLSARGTALLRELVPQLHRHEARVAAVLSERERATLLRLLARIGDAT